MAEFETPELKGNYPDEVIKDPEVANLFSDYTVAAENEAAELRTGNQTAIQQAKIAKEQAAQKYIDKLNERSGLSQAEINDVNTANTDMVSTYDNPAITNETATNAVEQQFKTQNPTAYKAQQNSITRMYNSITNTLGNNFSEATRNIQSEYNDAVKNNAKVQNDPNSSQQEKVDAQTRLNNAQTNFDNALDNEVKLRQAAGESNWKKIKDFLTKIMPYVALGLGIWWALSKIAADESGCFMFTTDSTGKTNTPIKLTCPAKDTAKFCTCGAKNCTDTDANNLPYCCSPNSPAYKKYCTDTASGPNAVYYGYIQKSPLDVITDPIEKAIDTAEKLGQEVAGFLENLFKGIGTYAKYFGLAILVVIGLVLLSYILPLIFRLFSGFTKSSNENSGFSKKSNK